MRLACMLGLVAACGDNLGTSRDGGATADGGPVVDGGPRSDGGPPLLWVDFAVTGCLPAAGAADAGPASDAGPAADAGAPGDAGPPPCRGVAPLALDFTVVAPAPVTGQVWGFGDGSAPDPSATPRHTYGGAGRFDVSLNVEGPGGTAGTVRPAAIEVVAAALGAACAVDQGCDSGQCLCGTGECATPLAGLCSADCAAEPGACPSGSTCATPAPGSLGTEEWQGAVCLVDCSASPCPGGTVCRDLVAPGGAWVAACFAPLVGADLGGSCVDPSGLPDDSQCTSGVCLAEGLRGLCASPCTPGSCPAGAACASFNGALGDTCLARCDADTACASDPWLGCELAGGPGAKGFTVDEAPAAAGYCAPKRCSGAGDCPAGTCAAGFCGP